MVQRKRHYAVSPDGFDRWKEREASNRQTLEDCVATNEDGIELSLADIAAAGTSNPRVRRAELMTRIAGLELVAEHAGHDALMVTWTLPSELHAFDNKGIECAGRHVTPREGHAWLMDQWRKCRSALDRRAVVRYGVRVVEPHADGTPHWHFLLFVEPGQRATLESIMRRYVIA